MIDELTGRLADGVRSLGDLVFGPGPGFENPDVRAVARGLDQAGRSTDAGSRRALAETVMRACPALGLSCRPADADGTPPRRLPPSNDAHWRDPDQ